MTNLEVRLSGEIAGLSESEKNAVLRMAEKIKAERGEITVNNNDTENHV